MRGDQSGGRNRAALHYRRFRPAEDVKKTKEERNPFRLGCFGSVGVFFSVHFDRFAVVVVVVVVVFFCTLPCSGAERTRSAGIRRIPADGFPSGATPSPRPSAR